MEICYTTKAVFNFATTFKESLNRCGAQKIKRKINFIRFGWAFHAENKEIPKNEKVRRLPEKVSAI